ncbi:Ubiquinone biosynthesis protein Coq4 [Sphingomonas laterariae]|uniref:Ubiquinone biosynthesis protein Coq4 n=1 Tax=Edaphosphingomonas laterariae TaxID=861865 RepID=A0A239BV32_9SPHN|nr:Coq4 family protein [Sphingomonas laterariae]SNS11278.1 Ubiquinone biosynthesis protein Coq4 [Sphingomonas laterariae]
MAQVSQADHDYYNGGMRKFTTESSVLISSSSYLNHAGLRALIAQEMLRRNGADLPNTAFIPQVAQILHEMEDMPTIIRLFEEEKARLPEFKRWLDRRVTSDFTVDEVKGFAPGTLGSVIYDFLANSGYNIDHFFQGMKIDSDYTFYLKERVFTHDIEHMITGFETNFCGEVALLSANARALYRYFRPELASFINRVGTYLKAKTTMKMGLYYPQVMPEMLEAEDIGSAQGKNWKVPLMIVCWRDHLDWQVTDIREEYGITGAPPAGYWEWTTAASQDPRYTDAPTAMAAE